MNSDILPQGPTETVSGTGASNATVSGAGSTDANGLYLPAGTLNGRNRYQFINGGITFVIFWNLPDWQINASDGRNLYIGATDVAEPWQVVSWILDGDGIAPTPIVTQT